MRNFYVVHYSKLEKRKKTLLKEFEKYSYNLIFNNKFDKETIDKKTLKRFNYRFFDKFIKRKPGFRKLKKSHISAWLKHLDIILNNNESKFVIIIEDDLILDSEFEKKFEEVIKVLPNNFGFCFFDAFMEEYAKVENRLYNPNNIIHQIDYFEKPNYRKSSSKKSGKTRGLAGYIFNLEYRELLEKEYNSQKKIYVMFDHWLNHFINQYNLSVYWVEPSIAKQGSMNKIVPRSW